MVLIENPVSPNGRQLPLKHCLRLERRGQLKFIVAGKRARMIGHRHDSAEMTQRVVVRTTEAAYDRCFVTGNWRVIQPASRNFKTLCAQLVMPR